jgi:hypothetical protein
MFSVALDIFTLETVEYEGVKFDCMVVCVCRSSGWIVAVPGLLKGLKADKVAKQMFRLWWSPFGLPSIISSDRGPQFANAWWSTMCGLLGIRQAFSHAYHHQANGRAERAGQQVMEILRKLSVEENVNWVHVLPRVVNLIHDVEGETGLSPYQIVFGRDRPLANLPYNPPRECEDAVKFFDRQREVDEKVAKFLNERHARREESLNLGRHEFEPFEVGAHVWYRRPEGSGGKLDSRWIGPMAIIGREGEHSYVLRASNGGTLSAPRNFLKEFREDTQRGEPIFLHYHLRTELEKGTPPGEREVDKILSHRVRGGKLQFLTRWKNDPARAEVWESVKSFVPQCAQPWAEYCAQKGLLSETVQVLVPEMGVGD